MDDLRLLRTFREVALRGSFSAAAEALAYSQPAVSQQIARLERDAGARLLERSARGLRLTAAGEVVLRHTERLLRQLAAVEAELAEVREGARGRVRVASFPSAAGTLVARAFGAIRRARPGIEATVSIALPPAAIELLRRGEVDVAVSQEGGFGEDPDHSGLHVEHVLDDPLHAVLPPDHPLATRRSIALADLAGEPLVLAHVPGTAVAENLIVRAFREAGVEPVVAQRSEDHFAIEGLVASGMGVALLPGLARVGSRADLVTRPLRGRAPRRGVLAVSADPPAAPTRAMLDALREAAAHYAVA
jgi:DNA-binding transcriptional LysR family regulator